jgi:hypothetical protein
MRQRPLVIEHRAEIAHIKPAAASHRAKQKDRPKAG